MLLIIYIEINQANLVRNPYFQNNTIFSLSRGICVKVQLFLKNTRHKYFLKELTNSFFSFFKLISNSNCLLFPPLRYAVPAFSPLHLQSGSELFSTSTLFLKHHCLCLHPPIERWLFFSWGKPQIWISFLPSFKESLVHHMRKQKLPDSIYVNLQNSGICYF